MQVALCFLHNATCIINFLRLVQHGRTDSRKVRNKIAEKFGITVQSALGILLKNGLIAKEDDSYRINDSLLRIFINNIYSIPEF